MRPLSNTGTETSCDLVYDSAGSAELHDLEYTLDPRYNQPP